MRSSDLDAVYRAYEKTVYRYLFCLTRDRSLSEELTQETFLQAVRHVDGFRGDCKINVWLCQIAKHLWYKELKRRKQLDLVPEDSEPLISPQDVEGEYIRKAEHTAFYQMLQRLDPVTREVFYMHLTGELSFEEIGDIMERRGIGPGSRSTEANRSCERSGHRMNKKTECSLVQDLLPSHLDGLTGSETDAFIRRHLDQCEDCYRLKRTMQQPLAPGEQARADMIDLLRRDRQRRQGRTRLTLCLLAVLVPLAAYLAFFPISHRIDHTVTATLWTAGAPEAGSRTMQVHVRGTYEDYLFRADVFTGTVIAPDWELFPGNAALRVKLDESGLICFTGDDAFTHIGGFLYTDRSMREFFIGLYDEDSRWSGRDGLVLTAPAASREEAVLKTREIVKRKKNAWLTDGVWEGSPHHSDESNASPAP